MLFGRKKREERRKKHRYELFVERRDALVEIVKGVTGLYLPFVRLDEYKGDLDLLVEDIWFELFDDAVSEVCKEALDAWKQAEGV